MASKRAPAKAHTPKRPVAVVNDGRRAEPAARSPATPAETVKTLEVVAESLQNFTPATIAERTAEKLAAADSDDDWWSLPGGLRHFLRQKPRPDLGEPPLHPDLAPLYGAIGFLGIASDQLVNALEECRQVLRHWPSSASTAGVWMQHPHEVWTNACLCWKYTLAKAREALASPAVAAIMDGSPGVPALQRWTSLVARDLDALADTLHPFRVCEDGRGVIRLLESSDPLPPNFRDSVRRCLDRARELRHVQVPAPAHTPGPSDDGESDPKPTDPTMRDLADQAGIGDDTFRRVRKAAGIEVKLKGAAARNRRYPPGEVDRLIRAALAGTFIERTAMADKWARWGSSKKAADKP